MKYVQIYVLCVNDAIMWSTIILHVQLSYIWVNCAKLHVIAIAGVSDEYLASSIILSINTLM